MMDRLMCLHKVCTKSAAGSACAARRQISRSSESTPVLSGVVLLPVVLQLTIFSWVFRMVARHCTHGCYLYFLG